MGVRMGVRVGVGWGGGATRTTGRGEMVANRQHEEPLVPALGRLVLLQQHALHLEVLGDGLGVQGLHLDGAHTALVDGPNPPVRVPHEVTQVHGALDLGPVRVDALGVADVEVLGVYQHGGQALVEHDLEGETTPAARRERDTHTEGEGAAMQESVLGQQGQKGQH
jgi:hypothetical protein